MNDKLELTCPSCLKENTVNLSSQLKCKHCDEVLTEKLYIKNPKFNLSTFKSIILGIIIGISGMIFAYFALNKDRYSTREEFTIISTCINSNKNLFARIAADKQNICIDAYNQTLEDERDLNQKLYTEKSQIFTKLYDANIEKLSK